MDKHTANEELRTIRGLMDRTRTHFLFSPWQDIEWGILVLIGVALTWWLQSTGQHVWIFRLWIFIVITGTLLEGLIWWICSIRRGIDAVNRSFQKTTIACYIMMVPAVCMTLILYKMNLSEYIPGILMVNYGISLIVFVILGYFKVVLFHGFLYTLSGLLSITILIPQSLILFAICFGLGEISLGIMIMVHEHKNI